MLGLRRFRAFSSFRQDGRTARPARRVRAAAGTPRGIEPLEGRLLLTATFGVKAIDPDTGLPTLSTITVAEGHSGTFRFDGICGEPEDDGEVTISYTLTGTAKRGKDYDGPLLKGKVTLEKVERPNDQDVYGPLDVNFNALLDGIYEDLETITVTLEPPPSPYEIYSQTAHANIESVDGPLGTPPIYCGCVTGNGGGATGGNPVGNSVSDAGVQYGFGTAGRGGGGLIGGGNAMSSGGGATAVGSLQQGQGWIKNIFNGDVNQGSGVQSLMPRLFTQSGGETVMAVRGNNTVWFDFEGGSSFAARFFVQDTLTGDGQELEQRDPDGNVITYYGFEYEVESLRGQVKLITDPYGNVTQPEYFSDPEEPWRDGQLQYLKRLSGGPATAAVERLTYEYYNDPNGPLNGRLKSVKLERPNPVTMQMVSKTDYTYYLDEDDSEDPTDAYGNPGDLKLVEVTYTDNWVPTAPVPVAYYHYETTSRLLGRSMLSLSFGPQAYARLLAAGKGAASDEEAAPYADEALTYSLFTFHDRMQRAVVASITTSGSGFSSCSGGLGTYQYAYELRDGIEQTEGDYNKWVYKTTETLPDGSTNTVYSNFAGEAMLKELEDVATGQKWVTYYRYGGKGELVMVAHPSAVLGYDPDYDDLVVQTSLDPEDFAYISDDSGLVERFEYQADAYLSKTEAWRGDQGLDRTTLRETGYLGPHGVLRVVWDTVFPEAGPAGVTTEYDYAYYGDTTGVKSMVVTLPAVGPGQNGTGVNVTETTTYDTRGRVVAHLDRGGYLTTHQYDDATGAMTRSVVDAGSAYSAYVMADGPADYWRLGESSGAGVNQAGANYLVYSGTSTRGVAGALAGDADKAIDFDGSSGYGSVSGLELTEDLTVEAWVNVDSAPPSGEYQVIAGRGAAGGSESQNVQWSLCIANTGGSLKPMAFHESGSGVDQIVTGTTIIGGGWHHVAVVRDSDAGTYQFVVDGVAESPVTYAAAPTGGSAGLVYVGRSPKGSQYFNGKVDELAVYGAALSAAQLAEHYSAGASAFTNGATLSLTTTVTVDAYGRPLSQTDPNGSVTTTDYDDANHETRVYRAGMPVEVYRENWSKGYTETLTFVSASPEVIDTSTLRSLSRSILNDAGQVVATDRYHSFGGTFSYGTATATLGAPGANYYRTEYGYDQRGRLKFEKNPLLTIRRFLYDAQGHLAQEWVGTDDTPDTGYWPQSTTGTNLVMVASYGYDGMSGRLAAPAGPGLTQSADASLPGTYYVKTTYFDGAGESLGSSESSFTVSSGNRLVVNSPSPVTGAVGYHVYVSTSSGAEVKQTGDAAVPIGTSWSMALTGLVTEGAPLPRGGGDGNLTQLALHPTSSMADDRVTRYFYDWRDRLVASKEGVQGSEPTSVNRPLYYYGLDNLGRVVAAYQYDGDGLAVTTTDGVPDMPDGAKLRALSVTAYDDLGRVYRTSVVGIDQAAGVTGLSQGQMMALPSLHTDYWYDARGNLIKTLRPGGLVQKSAYDAAGRVTRAYLSDGGGDTAWGNANDVAGDKVLEQTEYTYDDDPTDGRDTLLVTLRQRFHDEAGTGALGTPSSGNRARVSYAVRYFDAAGRLIYDVDYGTNGATAVTSAPAVNAWPAAALVTAYAYTDAGYTDTVTDPRGTVTKSFYDKAGRVTKVVEAYADGSPDAASDRVTEYTYDGLDHMLTMKAVLPSSTFQTTQYVYGVTAGDGNNLTSNDLLKEVQYPDKSSGSPGTNPSDKNVYKYNALGQAKEMTDQNQTIHAYSYDAVGRFSNDAVTIASGNTHKVSTAVLRLETSYDEAGRPYLFTSYDSVSGPAVQKNQVKREFNALGQLISEWQDHDSAVDASSLRVRYTYGEDYANNHSRLTGIVYPDGRVLAYGYTSGLDAAISRVSFLSDTNATSATLEQYSYLGLGTIVEKIRPQTGVRLTYVTQSTGTEPTGAGDQYTGLDAFGRVVDQRWRKTTGTPADVDRFKYAYDKDSNRLYKENTLSSTNSELYHADGASAGYDSLNRLTAFQRGSLTDADSDGVKDTVSSENRYQSYTLDALGNWDSSSTGTSFGTATSTSRTHDKRNELTGVGAATLLYDANGNMRKDENAKGLLYDAWNRLAGFDNNNDGDSLDSADVTYSADALGRRIARGPHTTSATPTDLYYSSDWQVLEERAGGFLANQYVWGLGYVDSLVLRDSPATIFADTSFDGDGVKKYNLGSTDVAYDVVVQPDGKILTAGSSGNDFAMVRFNVDGTLDTSFDSDGVRVMDFGNGQADGFYGMALQPDGKIVAVGYNGSKFAIVRYDSSGALDSNFGSGGKVALDVDTGIDKAYDVAIDPNGRIVVAGVSGSKMALVRLTPSGSLDSNFGVNGMTTVAYGVSSAGAVAVAIATDGKIVAATTTSGGYGVVRFTDAGAPDSTFGTNGQASMTVGSGTTSAEAVVVQPDGKVVVGGMGWFDPGGGTTPGYRFHIARFTSTGGADTSFDSDGVVVTSLYSGTDEHAFDLALGGDGRIVAAGQAHVVSGGDNRFAFARINPDGSIDGNFSNVIDLSGDDTAYAVALTPGGGVVMAGTSSGDFAVVRYGQRLYAQQDANFNVTSITDVNGAVQERYVYDPYGAVTYKSPTWGSQSPSFSWVYLHQGGRYDGSSKLYGFRHRDFSPVTGRWTSPDPAGALDGINLYQYATSSPASRQDPSGLLTQQQHIAFQSYVSSITSLINAGLISQCAGFAFLMGKLWDMNMNRVSEEAGVPMGGFPSFFNDAVHYLTDPGHTYGPTSSIGEHFRKDHGWTNNWTPPQWAVDHAYNGRAQGYIQFAGDSDTTGRHDHLIANMWARYTYGIATAVQSTSDASSTDTFVNKLGRRLADKLLADYKWIDGHDLSKYLHERLCNECECNSKHKGNLSNEGFYEILNEHLRTQAAGK
jgi:RHS repeat-associated protein/uncharacterized delta-60 repeat protein